MDFNTTGYLGKEINQIKAENYNKHKQIFDYCEKLNKFSLANMRNINLKDDRGLFVTSLYIKIINAFQGMIIMYLYGLDIEAQVIARSALESLFCLKAIINDEDIYNKFVDDDMNNRENKFKILLNNSDIFDDLDFSKLQEKYNEIKTANDVVRSKQKHEKIEQNQKKGPGVKDKWFVAEKAGMKIDYQTAYNILSDAVHPNFRNLQNRYMILNEDEDFVGFNSLPSTQYIELTLYTGCYILIHTLDYLIKYFSLSFEKDLEHISRELDVLVEKK